MARTASTALAMSAATASPPGYGLQVCKMKEVRFKGRKKLMMPEPIHGMMDPPWQFRTYQRGAFYSALKIHDFFIFSDRILAILRAMYLVSNKVTSN